MKRLVFCFDGTWNRLDSPTPTNVVLTAESVLPLANGVAQLIFYDEGVGTRKYEKLPGGMFGEGLVKNLGDGYRFLIFDYSPGDEIYVFGFSRGAYTARSFVGLINVCGVLLRSEASMVDAAIEQYKRRENTDDYREEMKTFRKDHSPYVVASDEEEHCRARITHKTGLPRLAITYLGVWDTVGALGIPTRYSWLSWINKKHKFHDTELSKFVKRARHAVAIDERRKDFEPTLWSNLDEMNADANVPSDEDLQYQERWFPGVHSSVGGGGDRRGLADQALDWVLDGARAAGLVLDADQHSTIYRLKPDYTEYIESSSDPGIFYKAMSKLAVADRLPGPKNLKQVSTKRRWLEQPSSLKDRFQYRPKTLNSVQKELDALNPADYGIREKDDPAQKYELYQVQRGDTLSSIAKNSYGHAGDYVRIYRANLHKLDSKDRIYPGQLLRIPRP